MRTKHISRLFFQILIITSVFSLNVVFSFGQPNLPPRSITVSATQGIHFGTFSLIGTTGGTITVGFDGSRISTGDIALLNIPPTAKPAIFEIKLCQGRNVIVTYSSTTTLTGSKGGSLILDIGPTEKGGNGSSFNVNTDCNFTTPLRVGGTLHIPGTAVPDTYIGSFFITFNQQ